MIRKFETYRTARRNEWKLFNASDKFRTWAEANDTIKTRHKVLGGFFRFGSLDSVHIGGIDMFGGRSKYMPHIGAKQRAKAV